MQRVADQNFAGMDLFPEAAQLYRDSVFEQFYKVFVVAQDVDRSLSKKRADQMLTAAWIKVEHKGFVFNEKIGKPS